MRSDLLFFAVFVQYLSNFSYEEIDNTLDKPYKWLIYNKKKIPLYFAAERNRNSNLIFDKILHSYIYVAYFWICSILANS